MQNIIVSYDYLISKDVFKIGRESENNVYGHNNVQCIWAEMPLFTWWSVSDTQTAFRISDTSCFSILPKIQLNFIGNQYCTFKRQVPHADLTNKTKKACWPNLVQLGWLFVFTKPMVSDWECFPLETPLLSWGFEFPNLGGWNSQILGERILKSFWGHLLQSLYIRDHMSKYLGNYLLHFSIVMILDTPK